jgi:hypothetical protein
MNVLHGESWNTPALEAYRYRLARMFCLLYRMTSVELVPVYLFSHPKVFVPGDLGGARSTCLDCVEAAVYFT